MKIEAGYDIAFHFPQEAAMVLMLIARTITIATAVRNVTGRPETRAVASASLLNQPAPGCGVADVLEIGRFERMGAPPKTTVQ